MLLSKATSFKLARASVANGQSVRFDTWALSSRDFGGITPSRARAAKASTFRKAIEARGLASASSWWIWVMRAWA